MGLLKTALVEGGGGGGWQEGCRVGGWLAS